MLDVQLFQFLAEGSEQRLVLFVKHLLVPVHFDAALLFQFEESTLMLPPHPLVSGHLFVHLFLHVLLLLFGNDRRRPNCGEVIRVHARSSSVAG